MIFKAGLMRWRVVGIRQFSTLSLMGWQTPQNEGCEMSFDEPVSVLVSELLSWFGASLSRRRNFLARAGGLVLLVLSVQQGTLVSVLKH